MASFPRNGPALAHRGADHETRLGHVTSGVWTVDCRSREEAFEAALTADLEVSSVSDSGEFSVLSKQVGTRSVTVAGAAFRQRRDLCTSSLGRTTCSVATQVSACCDPRLKEGTARVVL